MFFQFLHRIVLPLVVFVLFLSIGLNAFFLITDRLRPVVTALPSTQFSEVQELSRGPLAFGRVGRGFILRPIPTISSAPITRYNFSAELLPPIPPKFTLYRDQGVSVDRDLLQSVFTRLGVEEVLSGQQFFVSFMRLRSADRVFDIALDLERRTLSVRRKPDASIVPPLARAENAEVMATARQFLSALGIDTQDFGSPRIIERVDPLDSVSKTYVVWDATFAGFPLLDEFLSPVPKATVQVGRVSHRAVAAVVSLMKPEALARSEYPSAPGEALVRGFLSGGLLPAMNVTQGKSRTVSLANPSIAYLLYPSTIDHPLYVLPILTASWASDEKNSATYSTFIPLLDDASFSWTPVTSSSFSSSAPSFIPQDGERPRAVTPSSAAAVKTGTGEVK